MLFHWCLVEHALLPLLVTLTLTTPTVRILAIQYLVIATHSALAWFPGDPANNTLLPTPLVMQNTLHYIRHHMKQSSCVNSWTALDSHVAEVHRSTAIMTLQLALRKIRSYILKLNISGSSFTLSATTLHLATSRFSKCIVRTT